MKNQLTQEEKKKFAREWFGKARKYFGDKIVNELTEYGWFTVSMLACMCQLHEHVQEGNLDIYKISRGIGTGSWNGWCKYTNDIKEEGYWNQFESYKFPDLKENIIMYIKYICDNNHDKALFVRYNENTLFDVFDRGIPREVQEYLFKYNVSAIAELNCIDKDLKDKIYIYQQDFYHIYTNGDLYCFPEKCIYNKTKEEMINLIRKRINDGDILHLLSLLGEDIYSPKYKKYKEMLDESENTDYSSFKGKLIDVEYNEYHNMKIYYDENTNDYKFKIFDTVPKTREEITKYINEYLFSFITESQKKSYLRLIDKYKK